MHLTTVLANYQRLLGEHAEPLPYLSDLISLEAAKRQENGVKARIAAAHFPTLKTIESFDFTCNLNYRKPSCSNISKAHLSRHIATLFSAARPVLGKSHILSAHWSRNVHARLPCCSSLRPQRCS